MTENWKPIHKFENYSVSDHGRIRSDLSERILALSQNQYGVLYVGMVRNGVQCHRSVPLLVARAFIPSSLEAFDTPINMDGDRTNNHVSNLAWRPRWFAIRYNQQFRVPYDNPIEIPLKDVATGEQSPNSFECAKRYGLLESDLVLSIIHNTFVWPTYQTFRAIEV